MTTGPVRRGFVAVALMTLLLGACTLPGEERVKAVAASSSARTGGTITVGITPPGGVEPAGAYEPAGMLVSSTACLTLVTLDPKTGELRPGLAESWVVADRGASVLFKLRRGVTFTDGKPVDSRAVVESIRRLVNPDTASYVADLMAPLAGFQQYRENVERGDLSPTALTGARVNEPYSFELLFQGNHPDFVRRLAHPATAPVSSGAATKDPFAFSRKPVCAGGYEFADSFDPGETELRLKRSAAAAKLDIPSLTRNGAGWADEIVFKVFPDAAAAGEAYARGEVDVAPLPEERIGQVGDDLVVGPGGQIEYIGLPYGQTSLFNDARVRRALSAAIDREKIAQDVYGGGRSPASGFLPSVVGEAYRENACTFAPPEDPASPDEVRAALGGAPVKMYFNDEFRHRQLVEAVAGMWTAAFGITVEPTPLNWDQFLQKATTGSGFDGAFRTSWQPKFPAAIEYIEPLFESSRIGDTNLQRYRSVELDDTLRRDVRPATDEGDRNLRLQAIEDDLCKELPLIPIVVGRSNSAVRSAKLAPARADDAVTSATGQVLLLDLYVKRA